MFLKIIAWVGLGFMVVTTMITFRLSWEYSHYVPDSHPVVRGLQWFLVPPLDIIALTLMLVGGFKGKPELFWSASIAIGSIYILSYYAYAELFIDHILRPSLFAGTSIFFLSFAIIPGIVAIVEGIFLKIAENRKAREALSR